jgi:flagellar motor switch protein FliN/FliY
MSGATMSVDPQKNAEILKAAVPLELADFGQRDGESEQDVASVADTELRIELGRTELPVADVDRLVCGSVVRLDEPVENPVSVYADNRLIARGELLVFDDRYALHITETIVDQ